MRKTACKGRDLKDDLSDVLDTVNDHMGGTFGVGDTCGLGVQTFAFIGAKSHDQCNAITECKCDSIAAVCKCRLTWWFILIIVVVAVLILVGIIYCILRAFGCCKR